MILQAADELLQSVCFVPDAHHFHSVADPATYVVSRVGLCIVYSFVFLVCSVPSVKLQSSDTVGWLMWMLSLYHNCNSTTIRWYHDAFDYDGSDRNYDWRSISLQYNYDKKINVFIFCSRWMEADAHDICRSRIVVESQLWYRLKRPTGYVA